MKKQAHILYSGRVQGVGFRYTAREIADDLGITGWAKNLSDGRVEIVAEAQEEIVKSFIEQLSSHFKTYVQNAEVSWLQALGEFNDFSIKF
jgi:acylphosphatase